MEYIKGLLRFLIRNSLFFLPELSVYRVIGGRGDGLFGLFQLFSRAREFQGVTPPPHPPVQCLIRLMGLL